MGGVVSTHIAYIIALRREISARVHHNRRTGPGDRMKVAVAAMHESLVGTFGTCQQTRRMSLAWGIPECAGEDRQGVDGASPSR